MRLTCLLSTLVAVTIAQAAFVEVRANDIIVVSDLHLGVGRTATDADGRWTKGGWHPIEDFRWNDDLTEFLRWAQADAGNRGIDLVVAGDFLELWQFADETQKCGAPGSADSNIGCDAAQACERLDRILGAHADTLQALSAFAQHGSNRLIIVPGNHDAALVFETVTDHLLEKMAAPANRVIVERSGLWLSGDGQVLVEHGHQIEGDVNSYSDDRNALAMCVDRLGKAAGCDAKDAHLRRSWGENFVQEYYNQIENQFAVIDNLSSESLGVQYYLHGQPAQTVRTALAKGLRFLLTQQSWRQWRDGLGEQQGGAGDRPILRDEVRQWSTQQLAAAIDPREPVLAAELRGELERQRLAGKDLHDDAEIDLLCGQIDELIAHDLVEHEKACPRQSGQLSAALTNTFNSTDSLLRRHLERRSKWLREQQRGGDFSIFVYGHTHKAEMREPFDSKHDSWHPAVFNTGAFQRLASPTRLIDVLKAKGAKTEAEQYALAPSLAPEELPPCYSFISIKEPHAGGKREAGLNYWAQSSLVRTWQVYPSCPL